MRNREIREKPGCFIVSLDCEGLWGMADNEIVVQSGVINDASLTSSYEFLLGALEKNGIIATTAFVTAFAVETEYLLDNIREIRELKRLNEYWYRHIIRALDSNSMDGWAGAKFYRSCERAGMEMGWHGTTHLPLAASTSKESVLIELELAAKLFEILGRRPKTIIFPRNQVGHLAQLKRAGFENYREGRENSGIGRIVNLLSEFDVFARPSDHVYTNGGDWRVVPAGSFLNWPSGARKLVPASVTTRRWKSMLEGAAKHGGVVHMWFHPHNMITAPEMRQTFSSILKYAGELVRSGDLTNVSIADYVQGMTR